MRSILLTTLLLATGCAPAVTTSTSTAPTSSAGAAAVSPAPARAALTGTTFTMPADREMVSFYAAGGALVAYSTKDAPPPYASRILLADPPAGPWRVVYESDARLGVEGVVEDRIAFGEYREPYQGGGAYSEVFAVVDLATGQKTDIDRFTMSAATYRGGGSAPRRPIGAIVLGPDHVAWTRLVEGAAGSVTGELRIAPLGDPTTGTLVATSTEWVRPLAVDAHRLVYVLSDKTEESLHVRQIDSGADAVVLTGPVGDTARGEIPGFDYAAVSGDWAVWLDARSFKSSSTEHGTGHAVNLATGDERALEVVGSSCSGVSAGSRYFVWACGRLEDPRDSLILDAKTLDTVRPIPSGTAVGLIASGDGLIWFNVSGTTRTVTLFRP